MSGSDRGRRLAVSLVTVALFIASDWVPLPVAFTGIVGVLAHRGPPFAGAFSLALTSFLEAALIVELFAFMVPRWRALRLSGPAGRARLWRATTVLGLVFAVFQSYMMVRFLRRSGALGDDAPTAALVVATMTAGVALKLTAAQAVSRFGLGNGFSVLIAGTFLQDAIVEAARKEPTGFEAFDELVGPQMVKRLLLLAVVGAFVAWVLVRERRRSASGTALPFPASGGQPLAAALSLPAFAANLAALGVLGGLMKAFDQRAFWTQALQVAIVVAGSALLARLFNAPKRIAAAFPEPRRAILEGAARASVYMLLLGAADTALTAAGTPLDVTRVAIFVAVALDLFEEWRARGAERWVPVWPLARPYAVEGALASLRAAGISAFPRALQHRALLQALGPYITVDVLVPESRAAEARQVLEAA